MRRYARLSQSTISRKQAALEADLLALLAQMNRGGKNTLIVPSEYLEAVITKA